MSLMHQDLVGPRIDGFALVCRELLEGVNDPQVVVPDSLGTAYARLRPVAVGHQFDVFVDEREPGRPVAASKRFLRSTPDLDVLLRHRPRSITRRSTAFHAKQRS